MRTQHPAGTGLESPFPFSKSCYIVSLLWTIAGFHFIPPPNLLSSNSLFCLAGAEQQTEKLRGETLVLMERCTLERLHKPHFVGKPG